MLHRIRQTVMFKGYMNVFFLKKKKKFGIILLRTAFLRRYFFDDSKQNFPVPTMTLNRLGTHQSSGFHVLLKSVGINFFSFEQRL
jgi:hypothetical protein